MELLRTVSTISLISLLAANGLGDESDLKDLASEYPARDSNYASITDFIITGRCDPNRGWIVVKIQDSNDVTHNSGTLNPNPAAHGAWSYQMNLTRHTLVKPGNYSIVVSNAFGTRLKIPITIVLDPSGSVVPLPLPVTNADSKDFEKLSLIKLPETTISTTPNNSKELPASRENNQNRTSLDAESELAVVGSFQTREIPESSPPDVVLRFSAELIDGAALDRRTIITVGETLVPSTSTDDERKFQYRGVLRVPNRVGPLTLEAIHRGKVIAALPVTVRPAKPVSGRDLSIEYPSPDAAYLASSDIVVSGSAKRFSDPLFIDLQDDANVVKSMANVSTGDELNGGIWATRLYTDPTATRHPGKYQLIARPRHARQHSISIKIVADPGGATIPTEIQSKIEDYERLQRLRLAGVTIQSVDGERPRVTFREKEPSSAFATLAGREFAVEGTFNPNAVIQVQPTNVIIRMTGSVTEAGGEPMTVTVNEAFAKYDGAAQGNDYSFRAVLRAPDFPGTFAVEAIFGGRVIASSTVKVRQRLL